MASTFSKTFRTIDTLYLTYRIGVNPKPTRILTAGDFNTSAVPLFPDVASTYFNQIVNPLLTSIDAFVGAKMGYFVSDPLETTTTFLGLQSGFDHIITNFADSTVPLPSTSCIRGNIVIGTDHKRTTCTLTGFDSGKVRAGMQLWDSSDPNGSYQSWNRGIVTASRRGIVLGYVKTTVGSPTYDSTGLASNLPTVMSYQGCRFGTPPKTITNTVRSGKFISNGILQFFEDLTICQ